MKNFKLKSLKILKIYAIYWKARRALHPSTGYLTILLTVGLLFILASFHNVSKQFLVETAKQCLLHLVVDVTCRPSLGWNFTVQFSACIELKKCYQIYKWLMIDYGNQSKHIGTKKIEILRTCMYTALKHKSSTCTRISKIRQVLIRNTFYQFV